MSLQPAIPWQVALPQSQPPLHRPGSECAKVVLPVENFAANGEHGLNCLCQPRGQPHFDKYYSVEYGQFANYLRKRHLFHHDDASEFEQEYSRSESIIYYKRAYSFLEDGVGENLLKSLLEPEEE